MKYEYETPMIEVFKFEFPNIYALKSDPNEGPIDPPGNEFEEDDDDPFGG